MRVGCTLQAPQHVRVFCADSNSQRLASIEFARKIHRPRSDFSYISKILDDKNSDE